MADYLEKINEHCKELLHQFYEFHSIPSVKYALTMFLEFSSARAFRMTPNLHIDVFFQISRSGFFVKIVRVVFL